MIDLNLLRMMRERQNFTRYYPGLPRKALDADVLTVLDGYKRWFETCPDETEVDISTFLPYFFRTVKPNLKQEQAATFKAMLIQAGKPVKASTADALGEDLMTLELATNIQSMVTRYSGGAEIDLPTEFTAALDAFKMRIKCQGGGWNQTDIMDLLRDMEEDGGLRWRLGALRSTMRGLRGGMQLIVAARPDAGKTTFLASEATYLAPQLEDVFGEYRNILWLNNEGTSDAIVPRLYQAALGKDIQELGRMDKLPLQDAYKSAVGRLDAIRVFDIHGMHIGQVEKILEANAPGIVLWDMLDNVHGFGDAARTDLQLEKMYQRGRELAVKYDFVSIPTSQVSADADGELYPKMSALKDSKTGKQGACDAIIMIGVSDTEGMESIRGISTPKNKLHIPGKAKSVKTEVQFKPHVARYEDFSEMEIDQ